MFTFAAMSAKVVSKNKGEKKRRTKPHPMRKVAKGLYLCGEYTIGEISDELGVSQNTITKWRDEDKWDWEKGIRQNASKEVIAYLYEQLLLLKESAIEANGKSRVLNAKEADMVVKISNSIEKLSYRLSASTAMESFTRLNNLIKGSDAALAKQLLPFQTEILKRLA